jgi:hypothetical protein
MPPDLLPGKGASASPKALAAILALLVLEWPIVPISMALSDSDLPVRPALLSWFIFLGTCVAVIALARRYVGNLLAATIAFFVAIYITVCTLPAIYKVATSEWLDLALALALPMDSLKTMTIWIGKTGVVVAVIVLLLYLLAQCAALLIVARSVSANAPPARRAAIAVAVLPFALFWAGAPHRTLIRETGTTFRSYKVKPLVPPEYTAGPGDTIFFLQLESLNTLAVNGEYELNGKPFQVNAIPVMRRIAAEHGIFMPYVWSHDVLTNRAQQNILCGVVRNTRSMTVFEQMEYTTDCMPALLRKAGYKTVFLSSYWDGGFASTQEMMTRIGYSDQHYADFMHPEDPRALWGYEENIFLRRAFAYLREHYRPDERLLVHLAVCAHHAGFARKREGDMAWFKRPRAEQVESYIASARKQDAALETFWEEFTSFTNGKAHAFIFSDHSYPVGLYGGSHPEMGATVDNFITPMVYIPPTAKAAQFKVGQTLDTFFALGDLPATVAEIAGGQPQPNSMLPLLRRTPPAHYDFDDCQVMVQPFGARSVYIARGNEAFVYEFATGCVETFDLVKHPLRQRLKNRTCGVSFLDYDNRYRCRRYRTISEQIAGRED